MTGLKSVLVVDDEADVRWSLEMILRRSGFAVATVGSGDDALQWLAKTDQACDVILLDAKLPDMEGVDLAIAIRARRLSRAPLILVSGFFYQDDNLVQQSLRSGLIVAFVTKPFRHAEIISSIQLALNPPAPSPTGA
jgi:CheY-like chemotaxis protein